MEKLFSYGTLQQVHVQFETFGRKLDGKPGVLCGYILSEIRIKDRKVIETSGADIHPILKYTGDRDDEVEGMVFELTESELEQADKYEVDDYERILVTLKSGVSSWIYVEANHT